MIAGVPFTLFTPTVNGWTLVPATVSFTISSKPSVGGYGMSGYGSFASVVAQAGTASAASGNPVPVASALAGGIVGSSYSETVSVQSGTGASTLAVTGGTLPTGASMSSGGVISAASLTVAGTYTFTVTATDSIGATGSQSFTIIVAAATTGGTTSSGYIFLG